MAFLIADGVTKEDCRFLDKLSVTFETVQESDVLETGNSIGISAVRFAKFAATIAQYVAPSLDASAINWSSLSVTRRSGEASTMYPYKTAEAYQLVATDAAGSAVEFDFPNYGPGMRVFKDGYLVQLDKTAIGALYTKLVHLIPEIPRRHEFDPPVRTPTSLIDGLRFFNGEQRDAQAMLSSYKGFVGVRLLDNPHPTEQEWAQWRLDENLKIFIAERATSNGVSNHTFEQITFLAEKLGLDITAVLREAHIKADQGFEVLLEQYEAERQKQ